MKTTLAQGMVKSGGMGDVRCTQIPDRVMVLVVGDAIQNQEKPQRTG